MRNRQDEHPLADAGSFEQLVAEHSRAVHAYLARRSVGHADDLLSEVWLVAYAARHRFDPARGEAIGWIFGIARNVLLAHLRSERRRGERTTQLGADAAEAVDGWAEVDARLDAAGASTALREALASIPAEDREVLLLVAWEQLTPTEAATVLGIPPGTARSRLHRARARMGARISHLDTTEAMS